MFPTADAESVKISPQTLVFSLSNNSGISSQKLKIYNRSNVTVCFKIKSSISHKYHLSQSSGKLHNCEMSQIIVTLQNQCLMPLNCGSCDYLYIYICDSNTKELINQKTVVIQVLTDSTFDSPSLQPGPFRNPCEKQCCRQSCCPPLSKIPSAESLCGVGASKRPCYPTKMNCCYVSKQQTQQQQGCHRYPPSNSSAYYYYCCCSLATTPCSLVFEHRWKLLWVLLTAICILIILAPCGASQKTFDFVFRFIPSFYTISTNPSLKFFAWFVLGGLLITSFMNQWMIRTV